MHPSDPWAAERSRFEDVRRLIVERLERLEPLIVEERDRVVDLRKQFWDDVTLNFGSYDEALETAANVTQQARLVGERERAHRALVRQIAGLKRLRETPYFGFVAFREEGGSPAAEHSVYIGSSTLLGDDGETLFVTDWRAPIASLYYDYQPGEASYESPEGLVRGEMTRKLQFLTERGNWVGAFDSGVTIGDALLGRMLATNSDARMKTIVSTIQKEQNAAIRNDDKRLLVVHGPAGSGKTSAALQRVAYLLYKHRDTLKSEQMLLFSPNPMFMSYVDTVLPELGEEPIGQTTFLAYLEYRFGREFEVEHPFDALETLLGETDEEAAERIERTVRAKSDPSLLAELDDFVKRLGAETIPFRGLRLNGKTLVSRSVVKSVFASTDERLKLPDRLFAAKKLLLRKLSEREVAERDADWVSSELETVDADLLRRAYKEVRKRQRSRDAVFNENTLEESILRELIVKERFETLRRRVKRLRFVDVPELYVAFLRSRRSGDDLVWAAATERTAEALEAKRMPYDDAALYLHLLDALEGGRERRDVRHVLIDEAQDYSPLQLEYIKRLFPVARMTIVGDFRQAIFPFAAALHENDAMLRLYGEADTAFVPFARCYRSTREIVGFAKRLLADGGPDIVPFDRPGERPVLVRADDQDAVYVAVARDIRRLQEEGYGSIAVVAKTAADSAAAFERLQPFVGELALVTRETSRFPKGPCVVPSYLAKGVEFDAVLIADASERAYGQERERKLFYTACTRAMHRLRLYAAGPLSPFLRQVAADAYAIEDAENIGSAPSATAARASASVSYREET
ncbi:RNA polymerase recycling motor HelD [Paenibacillus sp.]|uniref:RNA polymerase recycling motor HelD n=1 Tax=Paenibacillus sp. TaxID=58172 RepID=UPI0028125002|nr:RNA polymerase recycling motor HelD [Paenibacillus sp.]